MREFTVQLVREAIEFLGWPVSQLTPLLEPMLGWPGAILVVCTLARLLLIPVMYNRNKAARTLALITVRRGVELNALREDPVAYREAFRPLYILNRVRPFTLLKWAIAQSLIFLAVAFGFASLYLDELRGEQVWGVDLASRGAESTLGQVMSALVALSLIALLVRARGAYAGAAWYLRIIGAVAIVTVTALVSLIMPLPLLTYLLISTSTSLADRGLYRWLVVRRYGARGWPIYDEHGTVIAYGFDDGAEPELALG